MMTLSREGDDMMTLLREADGHANKKCGVWYPM